MSGQYPPPNPGHPFTRAPTHPPWGQSTGMNMVGSSMNFYGSPHMGLPGRGGQPQTWVPQQTHPKPADPSPVYGLQMVMAADGGQRRPPASEYQQEETMDLSSHSSTPAEPKIGAVRAEGSDPLRNGTILPTEVNGETEAGRTEQDSESAVTSVIAANPLRESVIDALNCVKPADNSILKRVEQSQLVSESLRVADPLAMDTSPNVGLDPIGHFNSGCVSSVLKTSSGVEPVTSVSDSVDERPSQDIEHDTGVGKSVPFHDSTLVADDSDLNESQSSYLDSSSMTVDTDESKLVVAESPADDIFGMSPQLQHKRDLQPEKLFSQSTLASSEGSFSSSTIMPLSQESFSSVVVQSLQDSEKLETREMRQQPELVTRKFTEVISHSSESDLSQAKPMTTIAPPSSVEDSEPHPSVENVEILLESMFNSQEETSCSSQTSGGVPQSVIVSNGSRASGDTLRPCDMITPMREEELAKTLAEDDSMVEEDTYVKEEKREDKITDDIMDEIEKKLEMLTESNSSAQHFDDGHGKMEVSESSKEEPCENKDITQNLSEALSSEPPKSKVEEESTKLDMEVELLTPKTEKAQSSNPFIEVETELEKMFAGIVEPADEACSDNQSQPVVAEPKKPVPNRKPVAKRKKTNSRRPSDNSVFGGSSGESTPVRKKGRKRLSDTGSEKISNRKMKAEGGDSGKRGRIPKETSNDSLSRVKGPFLHIEGSKESPASVVVVNSGVLRVDDDDANDKASARRRHSSMQRTGRKTGPAYSSSTLSMRYNSDTADLSWVCVFCKKGPHCMGPEPMGDLFGPYRIPATPPGEEAAQPGAPSDRDVVEEQKRRGGGKHAKSLRASGGAELFTQKLGKKNKRSRSTDGWEGQAGLLQVEGGYEVWLHGTCAVWAPGLCMIGSQLVGLDDAVWTTLRTRCSQCGDAGAGIGCVVRNCPLNVHYHCAAASDWLLDTETFIARCPSHRTRLRPT